MRVTPIHRHTLDERGREVHDQIAGPRGGAVDGPFRAWLAVSPELAARMNDVGNLLRLEGSLDKRLFEVAVLSVARFWGADYQWNAHRLLALSVGVAPSTIEAIERCSIPGDAPELERLVLKLTNHLLHERTIPDAVYEGVLEKIGLEQMVELITTIGQYSMAAIVTNGFGIRPDVKSGGVSAKA